MTFKGKSIPIGDPIEPKPAVMKSRLDMNGTTLKEMMEAGDPVQRGGAVAIDVSGLEPDQYGVGKDSAHGGMIEQATTVPRPTVMGGVEEGGKYGTLFDTDPKINELLGDAERAQGKGKAFREEVEERQRKEREEGKGR